MNTIEYVRGLVFQNVQEYINNGPNCSCNNNRLEGLVNFMLSVGWQEIEVEDIESYDFSPKDMIKYVTKNNDYTRKGGVRHVKNLETGEETDMEYGSSGNKFRSGGWIIKVDYDERYILYKPYKKSQPPIPIQFENIKRLFHITKEQQRENSNKKIIYYDRPGEKTKYPVKLKDMCGKEVVVYYGKDRYKQQRFMNSEKYALAKQNGWKFK